MLVRKSNLLDALKNNIFALLGIRQWRQKTIVFVCPIQAISLHFLIVATSITHA